MRRTGLAGYWACAGTAPAKATRASNSGPQPTCFMRSPPLFSDLYRASRDRNRSAPSVASTGLHRKRMADAEPVPGSRVDGVRRDFHEAEAVLVPEHRPAPDSRENTRVIDADAAGDQALRDGDVPRAQSRERIAVMIDV